MILPLLLAALSSASPPAAQRPEQFDLTCQGETERQLYEAGNSNGAGFTTYVKHAVMDPWRGAFRVDLARGLWCQDKCTEVAAPAVAKPELLVLTQTDRHGARRRTAFETPDGTLLVLEASGTAIKPVRARCTVTAFTGIPDRAPRVGGALDLKAAPYPAD